MFGFDQILIMLIACLLVALCSKITTGTVITVYREDSHVITPARKKLVNHLEFLAGPILIAVILHINMLFYSFIYQFHLIISHKLLHALCLIYYA